MGLWRILSRYRKRQKMFGKWDKSEGGECMNFEYSLTKQDYIDFNLFHMTYSDSMRRSISIQRFILPIGIIIILPFLLASLTRIPLWYWLIVCVCMSLFWIASYPKYLGRSVSKRISKMLNEGENEGKGILGKHSFSLSEDGIVDTSEHSELRTKLNAIENVVESKDHIFIYISAISAFIIPTRIFAGEDHKEEFLKKVREMAEGAANY